MEKLSTKKKLSVVKEYLNGLSFDEIANKGGVSKGAVSGIVGDLKAGLFPEVADLVDQVGALRELAVDLKHASLAPGQCAVGLAVLKRVGECGLEPADIERFSAVLKLAGGDDKAKEFVAVVYHIQDFLQKTGISLDQVDGKITELETKSAGLEPVLKQVEKVKHEISVLITEKGKLVSEVADLNKQCSFLNPIVNDLQKQQAVLVKQIKEEQTITAATHTALAAWSKEQKGLAKAGFTLEELAEFNERVRVIATHHHTPVKALRERLLLELEMLDEGLKLEAKLQSLNAQLNQQNNEIAKANKECQSTKQALAKLSAEQAALQHTIKATREAVCQELANVIPLAKNIVSQFAAVLQKGNVEALEELRHLKDQALEVGGELGRYQGIVEANQWLADLQSLIKGEGNLQPMRARAVLLLVLRGGLLWAGSNQVGAHDLLRLELDRLVKELEQWRQ